MHTAHISAETAERRRKKVEDVQKRSEYRKAHGMDKEEGLGGWTAREKGEEMGPALRVEGQRVGADGAMGTTVRVDEGETVYKDWEGRKKPVKKWLGIW